MRVCFCSLLFLTAIFCATSVIAAEPIPSPTAIPPAFASPGIAWVTKYNEARKQGTESELPVMLFVTMNRCRYCVKMQQDSFADESVAKELNESFVPAKLYLEPDSKLAESLKITIYPTTMFIAPDGKIIGYIRGYVPRAEFRAKLHDAKAANAEQVRLARAAKDEKSR